ncbi:GspH/FimT family pseudopilin [Microbulbifer litoralis]|uniref:GspH/FimT family pseudopilin n=1 Tax=Microbulbifer litoralis TaxID=2933965 RepID=UPI002028C93E|nr:GspH/FimT family pseudopilin [Microbulbifer sp. GX H0434]
MKPTNRTLGFTLVELLITVSLLAALSAVAVPSFNELIQDMRNRQAGRELFGHMNYARYMAVSRRQWVNVCGSSDSRSCDGSWSLGSIVFPDENRNRKRDNDEPILRSFNNMPEGSRLEIGSLHKQLRYRPDGHLSSTGSFLYCPPDGGAPKGWIIIFYVSGRAYFGSDSDGDGIPERSGGENLSC